jgi:hypothetical protein
MFGSDAKMGLPSSPLPQEICLTCLDPTLQISSVQACDNPSTDANDSVHDVPSEASLDIVQCAVCEMPCFDFMKCFVCNKFVHEFCSKSEASNAICQLCSNEKDISTERSQAAESLKRQATRMRNRPEKFLTEVEIEHNVLIPLPNVDRGKGDPRNVMAVVTERVHNGYKLGTSGCECLYQVRVITVFTVFRLLTDFVCLYNYEF